MELTKREKRKLRLEKPGQASREANHEHEQRTQHLNQSPQQLGKSKKYYLIAGIIILAIVSYSVYSINKPGPYDSFAKCLADKGTIMYGAMGWCKYTQGQKAMFGKSFKYINHHEFQDLPGIKITPTWVINGEWHENAQSFSKLAALTGCRL